MKMSPSQTFSLLCRTLVDITAKNTTNGHNMPLLLLFHIVMSQRNLVFPHDEADTRALASYITVSFQSPKLDEAAKILADAFRVPARDLDITSRVKVRSLPLPAGVGMSSGVWMWCMGFRRKQCRGRVLTDRCDPVALLLVRSLYSSARLCWRSLTSRESTC